MYLVRVNPWWLARLVGEVGHEVRPQLLFGHTAERAECRHKGIREPMLHYLPETRRALSLPQV